MIYLYIELSFSSIASTLSLEAFFTS